MINKTINLKDFYPSLKNDVYLTSFCPSNFAEFSTGRKRKCVIVFPGGGYAFLSEREAEPVALKFAANDIAAFVLKYSIYPNLSYPNPFLEALAAVAYVKQHCEEYNVDKDKISVCGFSAGGHLAATTSALQNSKEFADYLNVSNDELQIAGCILGYPVISKEIGHYGTFQCFSNGDEALKERFSVEKMIDKKYPKTFIWHTTFDACVDVRNSLWLAEALSNHKVFYEMHIFPMHDHGQSLADKSVYMDNYFDEKTFREMEYNTQWIDMAIHFVKEYV